MNYKLEKTNNFFKNTLDTITNISYDDTNGISLCNSKKEIYNYDKVCQNYIKTLKTTRTPCSNDGLWIQDNQMTFIEFKNGVINNQIIYQILQKNYESLLIFFDLDLEKNISGFESKLAFSRRKIDFILVYNSMKNGKKLIHKHTFDKADIKIQTLEDLKGYLFHSVRLMTEQQFMKEIEPLI